MRESEENLRCVQSKKSRDWISRLASCQSGTRVEHVGELNCHNNWSTTRQKFQFGQVVSSQLRLVTHSNREVESPECPVWMNTDFLHSSYILL